LAKPYYIALNKCIMDQSCPVVHKNSHPQARLQTAKLFCNNKSFSMMWLIKGPHDHSPEG
jgi:hypothetical protein